MKTLIFCAISFCAIGQSAFGWTCRNEQLEVSCSRSKCSYTTSFTPMSVSVTERGIFSACAYSGCWEGRATTLARTSQYLYFSGRFRWTGTSREAIEMAILIDRKDNVASLMGAGFVNPMTCAK